MSKYQKIHVRERTPIRQFWTKKLNKKGYILGFDFWTKRKDFLLRILVKIKKAPFGAFLF